MEITDLLHFIALLLTTQSPPPACLACSLLRQQPWIQVAWIALLAAEKALRVHAKHTFRKQIMKLNSKEWTTHFCS